jgi:beta-alanine degradation protein BauB
MSKFINKLCVVVLAAASMSAVAETSDTTRVPYFTNDQVAAWKSVIYPSSQQILKMHRHDNNRVVVAFTDGTLKVTSNKGEVHYLKFKKEVSYFLTKDVPGEMHTDENVSGHPITLAVIEIKPSS